MPGTLVGAIGEALTDLTGDDDEPRTGCVGHLQRFRSAGFEVRRAGVLSAALCAAVLAVMAASAGQARSRTDVLVDSGWRSTVFEADAQGRTPGADGPFQQPGFDDRAWRKVSVPHNWQGYAYDRQAVKGARHGVAWYRTRLQMPPHGADERIFLQFEGVNSYATVWLNGRLVGRHAGGLTTFTLDVTTEAKPGTNVLAVRADNPAGIHDLPWVSGDDEPMNGFAEGSQPFGVFRPVHVIRASALRIRPFGLYAWGGKGDIDAAHARLTARAELENLSARPRRFELVQQLVDPQGRVASEARTSRELAAGAQASFDAPLPEIAAPRLWSPQTPTLYTLRARILENGAIVDEASTPYGLRTVEIVTDAQGARRLLVNGKPVFIRGIAEYEHLLGGSHAFSPQQVDARVAQAEAAGFNAFRDGHYPHNLRYGEKIARDGLMWWPQFSAHIWFDQPAFRANFEARLADWVRERRNNPAVFLWGLQNESILPADFARAMSEVIRKLDPTASSQRLIVTCNGGEGTDWNVPQNWSGTYGGDPQKFGEQLVKQGMVGEYGGWRSLGLHGDPASSDAFSEDRFGALMQTKARLADSVSGEAVGSFAWLLATHENPGRPMRIDGTQIWDGVRPLDHVGPANNKGLMTLWGEPTDAYYMYRARQVPASVAPMVYIVSHTWPDRWTEPGIKSGIEVFSNCDEVELFNGAGGRRSLGRKARDAEGRFVWNGVEVRYNVLSAACLVGGAPKAHDAVVLNNLPPAPDAAKLVEQPADLTAPERGRTYLYRVNVGGPELVDAHGNVWAADRRLAPGARWGWTSWADQYPDLDPALGSRRKIYDPVQGTADQGLFQSFRYGREALGYSFAAPPGEYAVDLYFVEPWYGRAGIDAAGWRVFDVAVNGRVVLHDLDIFREAGFEHALKKTVTARSENGRLVVSFPRVAAGEAVLSGVAISQAGAGAAPPAEAGSDLVADLQAGGGPQPKARTWLDDGDLAFGAGAGRWTQLPAELLDSDWIRPAAPGAPGEVSFRPRAKADLYLALPAGAATPEGWTDAKLAASIAEPDGEGVRLARYAFVTRRAEAGALVAAPARAPLLVRRDLPSPYAPGVFTFTRQTGTYEAEAAKLVNGAVASEIKGFSGHGYAAFPPGGGAVAWTITTGVAATHQLQIRYARAPGAPIAARLQVLDSSGIVLADQAVSLDTGEGWRVLSTTTPTAINAGAYTVRLSWEAGPGLAIDELTVL